MAQFIEYKPYPWWAALSVFCGGAVIPFLAIALFAKELVSTVGFVVIVSCGMGGLVLLNQ